MLDGSNIAFLIKIFSEYIDKIIRGIGTKKNLVWNRNEEKSSEQIMMV